MFANEDSMLKFFYDEGRELTLLEIDRRFTSSDYGELVDVLASLEKKNLIKWMRFEVWIITDIGISHSSLRKRKEKKAPTSAQKIIKAICIGIFVTVAGGLLLWWIIKNFTGK